MPINLSEKKLYKIGRIDKIVCDYFTEHPSISEISARELMSMSKFIAKGIFFKARNNGLPIRQLLRQLDAAGKLILSKQVKVVRKAVNRNWYFVKP